MCVDQVEGALQSIWRDNLRLRDEADRRKNKRSSFDPAQLTWIPRKRHNTRWPINPPGENTGFIAKLQPLIKFELHPSQIDETVCFEPEDNVKVHDEHQTGPQGDRVPRSPRIPEPGEPVHQVRKEKSGRRRRTLRPSLSTISESTNEILSFPMLTPTTNRVAHTSPTKGWSVLADKSKTPTKVAETPMKEFTLAATPNTGNITINSQGGQLVIPSSPTPMDNIIECTSATGHAGQTCTSSANQDEEAANEDPAEHAEEHHNAFSIDCADKIHSPDEPTSTFATALPFFDQPIPDIQVESKHESRRRVSLNNARHSDRTSDAKIMKRVHNWMAGAMSGKKRRHSDMSALHQPVVSKRRHTLDVDAGMNPDIFGQLKVIPTPIEATKKPMEILHERTEASLGENTGTTAISMDLAAQDDERLAVTEEEAIEGDAGHIENEHIVHEDENTDNEDEEDNVEDDSDMTYLQNFVQRSKSNKGEKRDNVPSAPILIKSFAKKRRSGSLNSATSDAGSPMAKMATTESTITNARPRLPLGEKDANKSPSPSKKRKLKAADDGSAPIKKKSGRLVAPDLDDIEPATTKRKKRRKGIESDTDDVFNPQMDFNQVLTQRSTTGGGTGVGGGPARRSTRIATTQKPDPAPINVRVPGGVFVDNGDMPAVSTAGITNAVLQRKADQDLANKTKANTRKNRGGAVPVQMALASMAERSGDSDADEFTLTTTLLIDPKVGRSGTAKTVRWDEILARVQGEAESVAITAAAELDNKAEVESEAQPENEEEEEDTQLPSPPQLRVVGLPDLGPDRPGNPVANQLATDSEDQDEAITKTRPTPIRRSSRAATVSRLPKRGGGVSTHAIAPPTPALTPKPKRSSLPAPSRVNKSGGGRGGAAAAAGTADARARLGMAGPGTPAPRRGGRRGGRRA